MTPIIERNDAPDHLFNIPELDFSADLFVERLQSPWFRLGAWTIEPLQDERNVEDVIRRETILIAPGQFSEVYDTLESVGNIIDGLGEPVQSVSYEGEKKHYKYCPFHQFEFPLTSAIGEPLVFSHSTTSEVKLFINPDLWLFLELEEETRGDGIWWDPRRGVEVLVHKVIDEGSLQVVDIGVDYLRQYLQARQMSLLVAHYRHRYLFDPAPHISETFVQVPVKLGSSRQRVKVIIENWVIREQEVDNDSHFIERTMHLWFEIGPQAIDCDDLWAEQPCFDPYSFTFPTRVGPVAPARWARFRLRRSDFRSFEGKTCDFMTPIYFRQEVLQKYEEASGFEVRDDGSVSRYHYWGLVRSTRRIGNELLATAIGDFAEGVPFEEWPHWQRYAADPPSLETVKELSREVCVPEAVNSLLQALDGLNNAFIDMALSFSMRTRAPLWLRPSNDSLPIRQLKRVYPSFSKDDEFLKRATLISNLIMDSLQSASLRPFLSAVSPGLEKNDDSSPMASRNLLKRVTLIASLIEKLQPSIADIPVLVRQAEGKVRNGQEPGLQEELVSLHGQVHDEFAPLAFLYELRIHGGIAHMPNEIRAAVAAKGIGLPEKNWHRSDYLRLLASVTESVCSIINHLEECAEIVMGLSAGRRQPLQAYITAVQDTFVMAGRGGRWVTSALGSYSAHYVALQRSRCRNHQ